MGIYWAKFCNKKRGILLNGMVPKFIAFVGKPNAHCILGKILVKIPILKCDLSLQEFANKHGKLTVLDAKK